MHYLPRNAGLRRPTDDGQVEFQRVCPAVELWKKERPARSDGRSGVVYTGIYAATDPTAVAVSMCIVIRRKYSCGVGGRMAS